MYFVPAVYQRNVNLMLAESRSEFSAFDLILLHVTMVQLAAVR